MKNDEQDNEMMGFFKKSVASRVRSQRRASTRTSGRSFPPVVVGRWGKGRIRRHFPAKAPRRKRSNQHGTKTNKQNLAVKKAKRITAWEIIHTREKPGIISVRFRSKI